ncbi:DNA primase (plasmid) [Nostoc flagelliforme CCNUN1]|uniref:DNA primase n=1 Tax=Nostoc flagelliforme CCNUN1 TaxID=2038116 RepID=A0A2K8TAL4_9NOSO|nr:DNA primase [Nostoc flagelliforme CCNUN1]
MSSPQVQAWKGLKLKMQQGMNCAGSFYSELVSKVGSAVGVADGEPYWNAYLGQWQVWVNFADGCRSVVCDWLAVVEAILG